MFSLIGINKQSIPTITYFPPDETIHFADNNTQLRYVDNQIFWDVISTTNQATYLRQDLSLLYLNGHFKGFINKWAENDQTIHGTKTIRHIHSGVYESISYHYSENHRNNNIRSAATMSYATLTMNCYSNNTCSSNDHKADKPLLKNDSWMDVEHHWNHLLAYFTIDKKQYDLFSITELFMFESRPLPSHTQKETDDIMHHLWEGLYENYFLELMETDEQRRKHIIPLIAYKDDEIRIFYEINGKKEQLIQKI